MPKSRVEVDVEAEDVDTAHYCMEDVIRDSEHLSLVSVGDTTKIGNSEETPAEDIDEGGA
jgi:hypothetical protein